jgi:hypothetical protein
VRPLDGFDATFQKAFPRNVTQEISQTLFRHMSVIQHEFWQQSGVRVFDRASNKVKERFP